MHVQLEAERNDLTEKLRQERLAHAATRVALRTGGADATAAQGRPGSTEPTATSRPPAGSVDLRAIMGVDAGPVRVKDIPGAGRRGDAMLRMRPQGAADIASPTPGHVVFPEPQAGGCNCSIM